MYCKTEENYSTHKTEKDKVVSELRKFKSYYEKYLGARIKKYCKQVYGRSGENLIWSIKNSGEILDKLKARDLKAASLYTYDFPTLYTTLPHNLIN